MRSALGAAGCLAKHTSTTKTDKTINIGQRDNFRKYKKLDKHKDTADGFRPLLDAIGFTHCVDPSVLENGVRHTTPFRQELHLDGAPSVIVPLSDSGCRLDCLMQPDDKSPRTVHLTIAARTAAAAAPTATATVAAAGAPTGANN